MSLRDKYTDEEWAELESIDTKKSPMKNNLDKAYLDLIEDILTNGVNKTDRTGTGTRSIFGRTIRHNMNEGFPLLTTKKLSFHNIRTELEWFLNGDTNIRYLLQNNNHIWVGDCYKKYKTISEIIYKNNSDSVPDIYSKEEFINQILVDDKFARDWGECGPIYGRQWRNFNGKDQINQLLTDLENNPDSRRLMVNAWNPAELTQMILPPCHYGFQIYTRELSWDERRRIYQPEVDGILTEKWADEIGFPKRAISLMWNQRSVDVGLGLPYNIASYGLLLLMIAQEVNMVPDELIGNLGDTHLYLNHIETIKEQLKRQPYKLPEVEIQDGIYSRGKGDIRLVNYQSHPHIKLPLSN